MSLVHFRRRRNWVLLTRFLTFLATLGGLVKVTLELWLRIHAS
jgi:hypothetical protein